MNPLEATIKSISASPPQTGNGMLPAKASPTGDIVPALIRRQRIRSAGKVRPMILLWALGVPIPILLIIFLVRGCA